MLSVQQYLQALHRAVLRGDKSVAKHCLGYTWRSLKGRDYLKWKLLLLCCSVSCHNMKNVYTVLSDPRFDGIMALNLLFSLCDAVKSRDAFALTWFVQNGISAVPYEVAYYKQWYVDNRFEALPFLDNDPVPSCDITLYNAARFLLKSRICIEEPLIQNIEHVKAADKLPEWATLKQKDVNVSDNNALNEVCFQLFVEQFTHKIEIIAPTVLQLKTTDNLLWTQYMATQCIKANADFNSLYLLAEKGGLCERRQDG